MKGPFKQHYSFKLAYITYYDKIQKHAITIYLSLGPHYEFQLTDDTIGKGNLIEVHVSNFFEDKAFEPQLK